MVSLVKICSNLEHDLVEVSALGHDYQSWLCARCQMRFFSVDLVHDYAEVSISRVGEYSGSTGPSHV